MIDIQDHFHFDSKNFLAKEPMVVEQHQMVSSCLMLMEQSFGPVVVVGVGCLMHVVLVYRQVVSLR